MIDKLGARHFFNRLKKLSDRKKFRKNYDRIILLVAYLNPALNIPQLVKIWVEGTAAGVSVTSWFGFAIVSALWFGYGLQHKQKPITVMNGLLFVIQMGIAISALLVS